MGKGIRFQVVVGVVLLIIGYSVHSVQDYGINQMQTECDRFGWDFYGFLPEPMCNVFGNVFPLRRLREMYPTATPFPSLPAPNHRTDG